MNPNPDAATGQPPAGIEDGSLFRDEIFWRDHSKWLEERGYVLRPRYRPGWKPSWLGTKKDSDDCEDGQSTMYTTILDATRVSDKNPVQVVAIKRLRKSQHPFEAELAGSFSQAESRADPRNHTVPILEILQSPHDEDTTLLVMPYLVPFEKIPFETVGEVVDFFQQLLEGLQFMHENNVAHRDVMTSNIMMEPSVYSEPPHPVVKSRNYDFKRKVKRGTRTERPARYYYTDLGMSCRLPPNVQDPREDPIMGGDRTVPEHQRPCGPQNPYKTDIYCLGNTFRKEFLQKYSNLGFLTPLVEKMVLDDPSGRPTIAKACAEFAEIKAAASSSLLRSRAKPRGELAVVGLFKACRHAIRTGIYVITGKPAIPTPHPAKQKKAPAKRAPAEPATTTTTPVTNDPATNNPAANERTKKNTTAKTPKRAKSSQPSPAPRSSNAP